MSKLYTSIDEFLANSPAPAAPIVKPETPSQPARPTRSPIRKDKPSVIPKPKASAEDVYELFLYDLKRNSMEIKFDLTKLKAKYDK